MQTETIFFPGGPVPPEARTYISRVSDIEATHHLNMGRYITIIGARQMGKTSLLNKLRYEFNKRGFSAILIDFSIFTNLESDNWYQAMSSTILHDLGVSADNIHPVNSQTQLRSFFVELSQVLSTHTIILFDEVPSVPVSNAEIFFSTLRSMYGINTNNYEINAIKLCFGFGGVFYPDEVISNRLVSPFNISQEIMMNDFSEPETTSIVSCLSPILSCSDYIETISSKVFEYTSGQPYLVQKICSLIETCNCRETKKNAIIEAIDQAAGELLKSDSNINHIVSHVFNDSSLVDFCKTLISGHETPFNKFTDKRVRRLYLIGVIKESSQGTCLIKNKLYIKALTRHLGSRRSFNYILHKTSERSVFNVTGQVHEGHEDIDIYQIGANAMTKDRKIISVLFLSSDPSNASHLRLGEEFREIQEKLQLSKERDNFILNQRFSVRPADISQAMLDVNPQFVHFSGHGVSTGMIYLEDKEGHACPVSPEALAALFEQFADQVNCVVLNACFSEVQAEAIAQHIEYVIGMNQAIGDKAAIAFAVGFYQALGAGRTVEGAYKLGCVQIRLQNIPEHLTPVLKSFGLKILNILSRPGSGPRTARGIRDDTGLDIAIVRNLLNTLKEKGYVPIRRTNGERWAITALGNKLLKDTGYVSDDLNH